jgi:hypothetical protein
MAGKLAATGVCYVLKETLMETVKAVIPDFINSSGNKHSILEYDFLGCDFPILHPSFIHTADGFPPHRL